jgi:carbonic anhydrase
MTDDLHHTDTAPLPDYLTERYRRWKDGRFEENRSWYSRLATGGQHPRAMVIQCSDSRVNAVEFFGAEPGDLFVVRNVANLVPPYAPDGGQHGVSAAAEYGVSVLKVAHVVVLGHSDCGGVRACDAMCSGSAPELEQESSFIGRWMDILRPAWERIGDEGDEESRIEALGRESVLMSLDNLMTFPFVREARADGALTLHGALIDIASGELHVHGADRGFAPI